jgi:hypothetical protein
MLLLLDQSTQRFFMLINFYIIYYIIILYYILYYLSSTHYLEHACLFGSECKKYCKCKPIKCFYLRWLYLIAAIDLGSWLEPFLVIPQ